MEAHQQRTESGQSVQDYPSAELSRQLRYVQVRHYSFLFFPEVYPDSLFPF